MPVLTTPPLWLFTSPSWIYPAKCLYWQRAEAIKLANHSWIYPAKCLYWQPPRPEFQCGSSWIYPAKCLYWQPTKRREKQKATWIYPAKCLYWQRTATRVTNWTSWIYPAKCLYWQPIIYKSFNLHRLYLIQLPKNTGYLVERTKRESFFLLYSAFSPYGQTGWPSVVIRLQLSASARDFLNG